MTTDPLGTFRDDLIDAAATTLPRRRRHRAIATLAGVAVLAIGAATVSVQASDPDRGDEEVEVGGPTNTDQATRDDGDLPAGPIWSIDSPPGWRRAGSEIYPQLSPSSITLASVSLSDASGGPCPSIPTGALTRLGPEDALISVVFYGPKAASAPLWPESGFDDDVFPAQADEDVGSCDVPEEIELHQSVWSRRGNGMGVLVAFGPNVGADRRAETWRTVSSLGPDEGESGAPPVCVTTRPSEPGLTVPEGWPARPPTGVWYGTPDLWTALPTDGSSPTPRKSVWWSARFLGGSQEPTPEINVTWERLDETVPVIQALSQGTNASSADSGSFMIAGIDPPTAGCWSVTASYRGTNLTYVYWNEPGLWVDAPPFEPGDSAIQGTVHFDEGRGCVVLRDGDGTLRPVVWPGGTVITEEGEIAVGDGPILEPGDQVHGTGSSQPAEAYRSLAPQGCMPDPAAPGEVFVLWEVTRLD